MIPTQFHSEYEIVKWLAGHDNFDRGLAELREALASGAIVNGRGLVQKWLSVYDDVTTGRAVGSEAMRVTQPAPLNAGKPEDPSRHAEALAAERTLLQRSVQEARLWAEASQEAAARADDARSALIEPETQFAERGSRVGLVLAIVALVLVALLIVLLWPQISARLASVGQALGRFMKF